MICPNCLEIFLQRNLKPALQPSPLSCPYKIKPIWSLALKPFHCPPASNLSVWRSLWSWWNRSWWRVKPSFLLPVECQLQVSVWVWWWSSGWWIWAVTKLYMFLRTSAIKIGSSYVLQFKHKMLERDVWVQLGKTFTFLAFKLKGGRLRLHFLYCSISYLAVTQKLLTLSPVVFLFPQLH